jgi:hypothetical protein
MHQNIAHGVLAPTVMNRRNTTSFSGADSHDALVAA